MYTCAHTCVQGERRGPESRHWEGNSCHQQQHLSDSCWVTREKDNHGHLQLSAVRETGISISASLSNLDDERKAPTLVEHLQRSNRNEGWEGELPLQCRKVKLFPRLPHFALLQVLLINLNSVVASCCYLKWSKPVTWKVIKAKQLCSLPHPARILHTNSQY